MSVYDKHDLFDITTRDGDQTAVFRVSCDAIKVGGLRKVFNPSAYSAALSSLQLLPLTPYLHDVRFDQAGIQIFPQPKEYPGGVGMRTAEAVIAHNDRINAALAGASSDGRNQGVNTVGKHWMYPLSREQLRGWPVRTDKTAWHGIPLHDSMLSGIRLIQKTSNAHSGKDDSLIEPTHDDYSMTGIGVHPMCKVNGVLTPVLTLYESGDPLVWGGSVKSTVVRRTKLGDRGSVVMAAQGYLKSLGFDPGPVDGIHGKKTEAAWLAYEAAQVQGRTTEVKTTFRQARHYRFNRQTTQGICIHVAQVKETPHSAEALQNAAATHDRDASWHAAIDNDSIGESVRWQDVAYAAGPANDIALHFELAGYAEQTAEQWQDTYSRDALANLARYTARACREYSIPIRRIGPTELYDGVEGIFGHSDVTEACKIAKSRGVHKAPWWTIEKGWRTTTHGDPGKAFPWDAFIAAVRTAGANV